MNKVNFNHKDEVLSMRFPLNVNGLRDIFPNYKISLYENDDPLLSFLNNKEVNVFDLNEMIEQANALNKFDYKKMLAVFEQYKPLSIDSVFNVINNLNIFILINDYETFYNEQKLGEFITLETLEDTEAYRKAGADIKLNKDIYTTSYGWLIEMKPIKIILNPNELLEVPPSNNKVFDTTITQPRTLSFLKTTLPQDDYAINTIFGRLSLEENEFPFINITSNTIEPNLYQEIKYLTHRISLQNLNEIADRFQYLDKYQSQTVADAINITKPDDLSSLFYLMDNLDQFQILDIDVDKPAEYALIRLRELTYRNTDELINILETQVHLDDLGIHLFDIDNVVETKHGVVRVGDAFSHFLEKEQILNHDY